MSWIKKRPRSTGLRDISNLLNQDFTAFQVRYVRDGNTVTVHVVNLAYAGAGTGTLSVMNLPAGIRPPATAAGYTTRGQRAIITTSGVLQIANPTASVTSVTFSYITTEPFPTVIPGVQA